MGKYKYNENKEKKSFINATGDNPDKYEISAHRAGLGRDAGLGTPEWEIRQGTPSDCPESGYVVDAQLWGNV